MSSLRYRVIPAVILVALASGCGQASPQPTPTTSESATVVQPSRTAAPEPAETLPARSGDAVASSVVADGQVTSTGGTLSADGHYVVRAACIGAKEMTYRLLLEGKETSSSTWRCGEIVQNSATTAGARGPVEVQLVDPPAGAEGFAEVIPEG